jgi:hypothetical protein
MPSLAQIRFEVPEHLRRFVGPEVKRDAKLLAARGMLPLPPRDLAYVLFGLSREADPDLKETAGQSLLHMPENILRGLIEDALAHPLLLDFMARNLALESSLQETVALNKNTHDETIVFQSGLTNKRLIDIISENQIRILRNPGIVDALAENILTGQAQLERIIRFVELETRRTRKAEAGEGMKVETEEDTGKPEVEGAEDKVEAVTSGGEEEVGAVTSGEESPWARMTFDADLLRDHQALSEEELAEIENNLYKKVQNMKVSEKIKLAIMGGANARGLLIKDANKMVSCSVLKSPRITENEVEGFSRSRSVSDEVIRIIANSREWTRNYQIKINLAVNPKTPQSDAMRFLNYLRDKDLRDIARSKNVPGSVAGQAKRIIQRKDEKSKPGAKK